MKNHNRPQQSVLFPRLATIDTPVRHSSQRPLRRSPLRPLAMRVNLQLVTQAHAALLAPDVRISIGRPSCRKSCHRDVINSLRKIYFQRAITLRKYRD